MNIKNLPKKYIQLWNTCLPILKQGRPGDDMHAVEVVKFVLEHVIAKKDLDILIPTAMMHDIGHSAILPEHFKYVTGQERMINGKLVHMLVGAKIAKDILDTIQYDPKKSKKIVDIISMHDADQLENTNSKKVYNTSLKKVFHDIDCMDRYNAERLKNAKKLFPNRSKLRSVLEKGLDGFFYATFKNIAKKKLLELDI